MDILSDLYESECVNSYEHLVDQTLNDKPFRVVSSWELTPGAETLLGFEKNRFENAIFTCPNVRLKHYSELQFVNCVFWGNALIGNDPLQKAYFEYCYAKQKITIAPIDSPAKEVDFYKCNADSIAVHRSEIEHLRVSYCRVNKLTVRDCTLDTLLVLDNDLSAISIEEVHPQEVYFPTNQIQPDLLLNPPEQVQVGFIESGESSGDLGDISETVEFFREHTGYGHKSYQNAYLEYIRLISQEGGPVKWLLRPLGFAMLPGRTLIASAFVLAFYATVYFLKFDLLSFSGSKTVAKFSVSSAFESLYFSASTFVTLSFGDIAPIGWLRFVAVSESVLGALLVAAFLASLINRYVG